MTMLDHSYPLAPSWVSPVTLSPDGKLDASAVGELVNHTLLLEFGYEATHKRRQGRIGIAGAESGQPQFFEANQRGRRFLNLTGLTRLDEIALQGRDCRWQAEARLLAFANPALEDGPVLILSPHPDDAELAAFGLYSDHAERSWIVTLSAGEKLGRLDRQYIPGLDGDLASASARKGMIRAWNSVTTPLLTGVSAARLFCLGYFNDSLAKLVADPDSLVAHAQLPELTPAPFRRWNPQPLPGDEQAANRGRLLVADLAALLIRVRPSSVLVTHPEVDPHGDHVATAQALALAIQQSGHCPSRVLLYANHLRKVHDFPYGPEHAGTTLPPWQSEHSRLGPWHCYSHPLTLARQKEKVVAMETMHDLHAKDRLEKRFKRWWGRTVRRDGYHHYGLHSYFQTHIKAHEVFSWVSGDDFVSGMLQDAGTEQA
jgi:LmbE family N-acetylglucosaminyl deacetylase